MEEGAGCLNLGQFHLLGQEDQPQSLEEIFTKLECVKTRLANVAVQVQDDAKLKNEIKDLKKSVSQLLKIFKTTNQSNVGESDTKHQERIKKILTDQGEERGRIKGTLMMEKEIKTEPKNDDVMNVVEMMKQYDMSILDEDNQHNTQLAKTVAKSPAKEYHAKHLERKKNIDQGEESGKIKGALMMKKEIMTESDIKIEPENDDVFDMAMV